METIINPNATEINLTVRCSIQNLETEGWDFETEHQNTADAKGISIEQARDYNYQNYEAELRLSGPADAIRVEWSWYSPDRNETIGFEDSGDDKKSIKDICTLIDANLMKVRDEWDHTVDSHEKYCPTFIQVDEYGKGRLSVLDELIAHIEKKIRQQEAKNHADDFRRATSGGAIAALRSLLTDIKQKRQKTIDHKDYFKLMRESEPTESYDIKEFHKRMSERKK